MCFAFTSENQFSSPLSTERSWAKCAKVDATRHISVLPCPKQIQKRPTWWLNQKAKSRSSRTPPVDPSDLSVSPKRDRSHHWLLELLDPEITSPRSSSSTREKRTPPPSSEESVTNASVKTTETDLSRRQKQLEHAILDVSDEFICPLSKELMVDPVLAEDGNLYERQDLERYIIFKAKGGFTLKSPVTGKVRNMFDIVRN